MTKQQTQAYLVARLSDADTELTALKAERDELREVLGDYMSQFGQALDAHGIIYSEPQKKADIKARAILSKSTK